MTALASSQSPGSERRKHRRSPCDLLVDIVGTTAQQPEVPLKARANNLSQEGVCIKMSADLPVGSGVSMVVYSGDYDSVCLAEIIWKDQAGAGFIYGLHIKHWSYLDRTLQKLFS